jgi:NO-binding membrane sensor protein with MHYT domain
VVAQYNNSLVVVSIVVASLASYTALDLTSRISASRGWAARAWLWGGAFAMGVGIWSMHFIGMLAFISPIPLGYDLTTTLLSLLIAIVASSFALSVVSQPSLSWQRLTMAGFIMGLAIVSMHYVGMAAIVLQPALTHEAPLVMASVGVAIAASLAALGMAFKLKRTTRWSPVMKPASAVIMGLAIAGMHYTAMAAVHISPDAVCLSGSVTDKFWLAGAVTAATLVVLSVTLILSMMDAQMTERTERMSASLQHAYQSNKAKDEFLAMLGHELRNPLAAISSAAELLSIPESPADTQQLAREIIDRQSKHLRRLVDDLLDVGRAMTGKMALQVQPLDLQACVLNAVAAMKASGRAAQHTLECSGESVWINGDATRIEQVVANLLSNSLTYSPAGSSVWVSVGRSGSQAILTVKDNGVGLSADELPRVFDLFYQSSKDGLHRSTGGLGIGLTLVRRLVELHNGIVRVESQGRGTGTTVIVRFAAIEKTGGNSRAPLSGESARRRKIVLVEDDRDALESLRLLLVRKGHVVITAQDGVSGLDRIEQERPAVGIIDIGLPRMDGYEIAQRLRAQQLPVFLIAVTGYGQEEDIHRAWGAGFDAHLTKPADLEKLDALIAAAP